MPIINPMYFYLIDLFYNIKILFNILACVLFVISMVVLCCIVTEFNSEACKPYELFCKKTFIAFLVLLIISIVMPSKETMYQMLVFKYLTIDNLTLGMDYIKSLTDYIFLKASELS